MLFAEFAHGGIISGFAQFAEGLFFGGQVFEIVLHQQKNVLFHRKRSHREDFLKLKADSADIIVSDLREKFLFQFRLLRREGSAEGYFVVIHGLPLLCHFLVFVKR